MKTFAISTISKLPPKTATSSTSSPRWQAVNMAKSEHAHNGEDGDPEEFDVDEEGVMSPEGEVPDGAAVFPVIPAELGVNPLLLAVVHALVFLAGSADDVVAPPAADEAVQSMANYLQRLEGPGLAKVREDMACLTA